jgi:hypothetical protein
VRRLVLALKLALASLAFAVYVWFAAVLNVGRVKRRKAARRVARRADATRPQPLAETRPATAGRPDEAGEVTSSP